MAVLLSIDQLVILHQMVKMSASSKKIQLDEHCGFQAKDFTSDRAFQNHYRDHSQALFQCEKCPIKVNTRKKLSNHNFEYHSSNLTCSQCYNGINLLHFTHFDIWYPFTFIWLLLSGSQIGSLVVAQHHFETSEHTVRTEKLLILSGTLSPCLDFPPPLPYRSVCRHQNNYKITTFVTM